VNVSHSMAIVAKTAAVKIVTISLSMTRSEDRHSFT